MAGNRGNSIEIARSYMDSLYVEGRIVGSVHPTTEFTLFGKRFRTPVMTGALSHLNRIHPDGVPEMARGAALAGACAQIGMGDVAELERAVSMGDGVIKVIKPYKNTDAILSRIEAAEKVGALAVGMDLEHAVNTDDDKDSVVVDQQMELKSIEQIRELVQFTHLPFIVKGALSVQDAVRCRDLGVEGLILSHHNSLLKWAVPPVALLSGIRKAVGSDLILIVDGGIEDGTDAYKALALGADAVSVGRPLMGPLGEKGAEGVQQVIEQMTDGLKAMMVRTGVADLKHMDPTVIWQSVQLVQKT